jgi:hypothetical protein
MQPDSGRTMPPASTRPAPGDERDDQKQPDPPSSAHLIEDTHAAAPRVHVVLDQLESSTLEMLSFASVPGWYPFGHRYWLRSEYDASNPMQAV